MPAVIPVLLLLTAVNSVAIVSIFLEQRKKKTGG